MFKVKNVTSNFEIFSRMLFSWLLDFPFPQISRRSQTRVTPVWGGRHGLFSWIFSVSTASVFWTGRLAFATFLPFVVARSCFAWSHQTDGIEWDPSKGYKAVKNKRCNSTKNAGLESWFRRLLDNKNWNKITFLLAYSCTTNSGVRFSSFAWSVNFCVSCWQILSPKPSKISHSSGLWRGSGYFFRLEIHRE